MVCIHTQGSAPSDEHEVAHLCGKGHEGCINPHHLSWKTSKENNADKLKHGTYNGGTKHCFAKLTEEDVRTIRREAVRRKVTFGQLAERFGMSAEAIGRVYRRQTYKNVE
jgi:hypothetical protein